MPFAGDPKTMAPAFALRADGLPCVLLDPPLHQGASEILIRGSFEKTHRVSKMTVFGFPSFMA